MRMTESVTARATSPFQAHARRLILVVFRPAGHRFSPKFVLKERAFRDDMISSLSWATSVDAVSRFTIVGQQLAFSSGSTGIFAGRLTSLGCNPFGFAEFRGKSGLLTYVEPVLFLRFVFLTGILLFIDVLLTVLHHARVLRIDKWPWNCFVGIGSVVVSSSVEMSYGILSFELYVRRPRCEIDL